MSSLLFGILEPSPGSRIQAEPVAWHALRDLAALGLSMQVGNGIVQRSVLRWLGFEPGAIHELPLPFLITSSPLRDTSDELIDAYHYLASEHNQFTPMRAPLQHIQAGAERLLSIPGVSQLQLVLTECNAPPYEELAVEVAHLAERLLQEYIRFGSSTPELKLTVRCTNPS